MKRKPAAAVSRALRFLHIRQMAHGEFRTQASDFPSGVGLRYHSSAFVTSFVVHSLSAAGNPLAQDIVRRACRFLRSECEPPGVWKYFSSLSVRPPDYEADLDTTACAAEALRRAGYPAHCAPSVFLRNRDRRGRFMTWLRSQPAANDVDSVVNANVLLYLGDRPGTAAACAYLNAILAKGGEAESFRYYFDPLMLHYASARAYKAGALRLAASAETVKAKILRRLSREAGALDPLLCAFAACALVNLGCTAIPPALVRRILRLQRNDGSWRWVGFFTGGPGGQWVGSQELTTALCVEALIKLQRQMRRLAITV